MQIIMTNPDKGYEVLCMVKSGEVMVSRQSLFDGMEKVIGPDCKRIYTVVNTDAYMDAAGVVWISKEFAVSVRGRCESSNVLELEKVYVNWVREATSKLSDKLVAPESCLNMSVIPDAFEEPVRITDEGLWYATGMARQYRKNISDWLANKDTQDIINKISEYGYSNGLPLMRIVMGGDSKAAQGLWLHDRIVRYFCEWLSVDLRVKFIDLFNKASMNMADVFAKLAQETKATEIPVPSFTTSKK